MISPYLDRAGSIKANEAASEALSLLNNGAARDLLPSSGKAVTNFITSIVDKIEGRGPK